MTKRIEMIEEYIVQQSDGTDYNPPSYIWTDNKGQLVRCKDCKFNPKYEWFGCPMSHLSEKQRPETAWCWKGERRADE